MKKSKLEDAQMEGIAGGAGNARYNTMVTEMNFSALEDGKTYAIYDPSKETTLFRVNKNPNNPIATLSKEELVKYVNENADQLRQMAVVAVE